MIQIVCYMLQIKVLIYIKMWWASTSCKSFAVITSSTARLTCRKYSYTLPIILKSTFMPTNVSFTDGNNNANLFIKELYIGSDWNHSDRTNDPDKMVLYQAIGRVVPHSISKERLLWLTHGNFGICHTHCLVKWRWYRKCFRRINSLGDNGHIHAHQRYAGGGGDIALASHVDAAQWRWGWRQQGDPLEVAREPPIVRRQLRQHTRI